MADLDAAREELGIADDADAIDLEAVSGGDLDLESPEYQLINVAINVVPPVRQFAQTFESPPLLEALDGGAISAGAADQAGLAGAPAAIRTSQSFDELADELAAPVTSATAICCPTPRRRSRRSPTPATGSG